jgi:hypothetical protein
MRAVHRRKPDPLHCSTAWHCFGRAPRNDTLRPPEDRLRQSRQSRADAGWRPTGSDLCLDQGSPGPGRACATRSSCCGFARPRRWILPAAVVIPVIAVDLLARRNSSTRPNIDRVWGNSTTSKTYHAFACAPPKDGSARRALQLRPALAVPPDSGPRAWSLRGIALGASGLKATSVGIEAPLDLLAHRSEALPGALRIRAMRRPRRWWQAAGRRHRLT